MGVLHSSPVLTDDLALIHPEETHRRHFNEGANLSPAYVMEHTLQQICI